MIGSRGRTRVSQRSSTAPSSSSDCTIPPASSAATATSASVGEARRASPPAARVRSAGSSRRVAAGSAATSTARPPIHAPAASTCSTLAGSRTATGSCTPAWPPSPGRSASASTGTASAQVHGPGAGQRDARRADRRRPQRRQAAGGARRAAPITQPREHAEPPDDAEARLEHVARAAERGPQRRALRPSRPAAPAPRAPRARPRRPTTSSSVRARRGEGRGGRAPSAARRRPSRAAPGSQTSSSTASTPSAERDRRVLDGARRRRTRPTSRGRRSWSPSRSATLAAGAAASLADAEHEAAADGVRVGRDDAVGRRCSRRRGSAVAQPDRDLVAAAAAGGTARPAGPASPSASNTRTAPKAISTGSLKRSTTCPGARSTAAPRSGDGALEQRVRLRGRAPPPARRRARRAACAQPGSPGLRGLRAVAGVAPPAQRGRRRCRARSARRPRSRSGPSAAPPPGSGTQSSVPAICPGAPPTVIGTFQSKMWARASSSLTCGGLDLAHPVHAVVVPLEAPAAAELLPARRLGRGPAGTLTSP